LLKNKALQEEEGRLISNESVSPNMLFRGNVRFPKAFHENICLLKSMRKTVASTCSKIKNIYFCKNVIFFAKTFAKAEREKFCKKFHENGNVWMIFAKFR
jgi:hypothetical protein